MAVRDNFTPGEVLLSADLNDTFADKAVKSAGFQFAETVYFTSNGTFAKATYPWLRAIRVRLVGGGGGGGGAATTGVSQVANGSSGGGGAYAESLITDIVGLASSVTVTVGSGGAGGAAGANAGTAGGNSSFGALVSANGGNAGTGGTAFSVYVNIPSAGATSATGDLVIRGSDGEVATVPVASQGLSGAGGSSFLGSTRSGNFDSNGHAGRLYGSGASGTLNRESQATARAGGAGADGIVIVELFA
jgi:hypothetical protein